ncbi:UbiX family flavin prenyltransferase [Chloroflexota bacterium]
MGLNGKERLNMKQMVLIIGITGASGAIYGIRLLEVLAANKNVATHLILSESAEMTIHYETDYRVEDVRALASFVHNIKDVGSRLSSGSFKTDGMIVAPCTIKTMSALANSYTDNLIVRAGDVTLKECRRLILLVRETPLHIGHLRSMEKLCEMGAIIMPPMPAFYYRPQSISEIIDHTIGKTLDLLGIEHNLFRRWSGLTDAEASFGRGQ